MIAWQPSATGRDAGDGVKRVVGDLAIASHPPRGAVAPGYLAAGVGAVGV